ncbi:MAG: TraR/DksA family transcriptional regulator [Bryobacteraceae bacterium]
MTKEREDQFKRFLEARRAKLLLEIAAERERLSAQHYSDPMDHSRGLADREIVMNNLVRLFEAHDAADQALAEIHGQTFGVCASCGNEIPTKRLEAVPWSRFCVSCQEMAERQESEIGYSLPN